ncbi:MAG: ATP-binding cassette domain-containing protein [Candidatus Lokiarchaeota archaeon]|nr:ATP-binding cassette domain-containing protein [Candidatus Lokiarchaeota archaeon]
MIQENPIIIKTQDLSKKFGQIQALTNLNLQVKKNSIFGFLGPNGAGKTTTIKLLLGLISPTSGSATIFNYDIIRESIKIRSRVGYLPQNPFFYENMTAREILEFSIKFFFSGSIEAIDSRIEEVLELVELSEKANRPIKGYSGGERQRLGIAQSVIHKPDLLILDEPTASLDPIGRHAVLELMSKLREDTTIFYSTHILDDVQRVSDTVAILNKGKLVAQGPIEELLAGSEGVVYVIKTKNSSEIIREKMIDLPWITNIQISQERGQYVWLVNVNSEEKAEEQLLRTILSDKSIRITEYRKQKFELEDIFLKVIKEDENEFE